MGFVQEDVVHNGAADGVADVEQQQGVAGKTADAVDESAKHRRGTTVSACFEMFIAVMGPGALSLASAMSALGWLAGLICMAVFGLITFGFAHVLIMCHEYQGKRYPTYYTAVHDVLGKRHAIALVWIQQINIVLVALAYAITGGTSLQTIALLILPLGDTSRWAKTSVYVLIFSAVMLFVIQISTLGELGFVCILGALCVIVYDGILIYLGADNWGFTGSTGSLGGEFASPVSKMWDIFNAFGILFFTWGCAFVLLEIVNTIHTQPVRRARKALNGAYVMVSVLLFTVAITTYGGVGDNATGWFLDAFVDPQWLLILTNLLIVLSLIPGYNLYLLPFLLMVERPLERRLSCIHPRIIKLIWRSLVVIILAVIGALLPFFSSFISLVGAIGFWPISIYFPLAMWTIIFKPSFPVRMALQTVSVFALLVTLLAIVGSVESIVESASSFVFGWQ